MTVRLPEVAVLEMTWRCNHSCLFCSCPWYAASGAYPRDPELDTAGWFGALARLKGMGVRSIAFSGGEALLRDDLPALLEEAHRLRADSVHAKGFRNIQLLSNGKAMREDILQLCRRFDIALGMSLPGLSTFPQLTGGEDPRRVLHWFQEARKLGIVATAGITLTSVNIHEIRETAAAALLAGASRLLINRYTPGGRGLSHPELVITVPQLKIALAAVNEVLERSGRTGSLGTELPLCHVDPNLYPRLKIDSHCAAAVGFFAVDPAGWVRVCNHSPVRVAPLDDPDAIFRHPHWRTFALRAFTPDACMDCAANTRCHAGCRESAHILGGHPWSDDPVFPPVPLASASRTSRTRG